MSTAEIMALSRLGYVAAGMCKTCGKRARVNPDPEAITGLYCFDCIETGKKRRQKSRERAKD